MPGLYLWISQTSKIRVKIKLDASAGSWQGEPPNKKNQEHDVGECSSEIHYLRVEKISEYLASPRKNK